MIFRSALVLLLLCAGGATIEAEPDTRVRRGWDYTVEPSADLSKIRVSICFRRFLPRRLVLSSAGARGALTYLPGTDGDGTLSADPESNGVVATGLRPGRCIAYEVDVEKLLWGWRGWEASRVGRDVLLWPGLFLLRPAVWPRSVYVTARFVCPGGIDVNPPWWSHVHGSGVPEHYALVKESLTLEGSIAFGRFDVHTLQAHGSTFDVSLLDRRTDTALADITAWLTGAARAVSMLYGRFPVPRTQVLINPVGPSRRSVVFGRSMRPAGASTLFYVAANAEASSLVGEWVGIHELLHLGMPWTYPEEAWFQEGFVTYYQEVIRARAGFLTPRDGWQMLHEGFGRGASSHAGPTLDEASREMHRRHWYWRVYWGGAAIAFHIDLELRRVYQGRRSLDDVMRFLYERHGKDRAAPLTGLEALAEADRWLGKDICVPIARRGLAWTRQPDWSSAFRDLGLVVERGTVVMRPDAPRSADARAIMGGPKDR